MDLMCQGVPELDISGDSTGQPRDRCPNTVNLIYIIMALSVSNTEVD
jgi:hypothetical protein